MQKMLSALEAVQCIASGNRIFIQGAAMTPTRLIQGMVQRANELKDVKIIHIHTEGEASYTKPEYEGIFYTQACFTGGNIRKAIQNGDADYIPVFLSEIPLLFRRNILPIDVALIQVSPPDQHGFCSLGVSVDVTLAALESAKKVVAQINPQVPRTHGESNVHISKIDFAIEINEPIFEHEPDILSENSQKIGKAIASLVEDGATLQMGIGEIPNAVLAELGNHKRLGIHTEMFSDGIIPLVEKGVITNEEKRRGKGRIVSCFAVGSRKLYDFVNDNPLIEMRDTAYTNDTSVIRQNPKVTAINSAIEVDLTGQICADTIGMMQFSGVGGQMDFIRGAALSEGGKPIIALESQTRKGESKIVTFLKQGAAVTTTRAHVHYVVTEFGIADLFGKTLRERAKASIEIAHPQHREMLEKQARERFGKW